jgi:predicted dehydrogenase
MATRIGFVDYKLENYHANVFLKAYRGELKDRATVAGCFALDEADGRAWAKKNDVPYFDSVQKLHEQIDAFMILAPSNPELHFKLAEMVLPFGQPTYVDKTFAPDLATAKQIFELADRHKAPVQTTSALRYTNVQDHVKTAGGREAVKHMVAWGGGSSFGEYAIHPLELIVSCMGHEVESLMRRGGEQYAQLLINYTGGRTAVANVYTRGNTPFAAGVTTEKETKLLSVDTSKIFLNNAAAVLEFFESAKPNVDRSESLTIRRILDAAAADAAAKSGFVKV